MNNKKLVATCCVLACSACACYVGAANCAPSAVSGSPAPSAGALPPGHVRVATYNVVHGTRFPLPPSLVRESVVQGNLRAIGQWLHAEQPLVVALQETDHGRRNNRAESIARYGQFAYWADDASVSGHTPRHGVALLSTAALQEPISKPLVRGATHDKGWVAATVTVDAWGGEPLRVVALHLDPFSARARERQVDQLVAELESQQMPVVVLGDFNCGWEQGRCVQRLASRLGLHAAPTQGCPTYAFLGMHRNLDWILVSSDLEVAASYVSRDSYSDHRPVVAELARREK
ncbi:MAG: endonuclease/exonuclease/phosphatase family protein [Deltaproteobacteria bacterium]|nr:endonuclease/exonuclease/phosphatase family protein [Deltaproteobacteria bacterium]